MASHDQQANSEHVLDNISELASQLSAALRVNVPIKKLLFVDTNIWLDFYRARSESGLTLLKHLEDVSENIIVTYQLESEFKKNRQAAILEGMSELKSPEKTPRLGIFSDAQATKTIGKNLKAAESRVKKLKRKLEQVLRDPAAHDPVYKACHRIFHREAPIVLTRLNDARVEVRWAAFRRYLHGCPPRKKNDTSFGDAFNWEWMIKCANDQKAELVIVSRDADYGITFENRSYINDHLKQEFSERVSRKRKILLYTRLSDALKHFSVAVTAAEEALEAELVAPSDSLHP